jgi:hypothetical protein
MVELEIGREPDIDFVHHLNEDQQTDPARLELSVPRGSRRDEIQAADSRSGSGLWSALGVWLGFGFLYPRPINKIPVSKLEVFLKNIIV